MKKNKLIAVSLFCASLLISSCSSSNNNYGKKNDDFIDSSNDDYFKDDTSKEYEITYSKNEHATISLDKTKAKKGEKVTISFTLKDEDLYPFEYLQVNNLLIYASKLNYNTKTKTYSYTCIIEDEDIHFYLHLNDVSSSLSSSYYSFKNNLINFKNNFSIRRGYYNSDIDKEIETKLESYLADIFDNTIFKGKYDYDATNHGYSDINITLNEYKSGKINISKELYELIVRCNRDNTSFNNDAYIENSDGSYYYSILKDEYHFGYDGYGFIYALNNVKQALTYDVYYSINLINSLMNSIFRYSNDDNIFNYKNLSKFINVNTSYEDIKVNFKNFIYNKLTKFKNNNKDFFNFDLINSSNLTFYCNYDSLSSYYIINDVWSNDNIFSLNFDDLKDFKLNVPYRYSLASDGITLKVTKFKTLDLLDYNNSTFKSVLINYRDIFKKVYKIDEASFENVKFSYSYFKDIMSMRGYYISEENKECVNYLDILFKPLINGSGYQKYDNSNDGYYLLNDLAIKSSDFKNNELVIEDSDTISLIKTLNNSSLTIGNYFISDFSGSYLLRNNNIVYEMETLEDIISFYKEFCFYESTIINNNYSYYFISYFTSALFNIRNINNIYTKFNINKSLSKKETLKVIFNKLIDIINKKIKIYDDNFYYYLNEDFKDSSIDFITINNNKIECNSISSDDIKDIFKYKINYCDSNGNYNAKHKYYIKKPTKLELNISKSIDGDTYSYIYKKDYISIFNDEVLSAYLEYFRDLALNEVYKLQQ